MARRKKNLVIGVLLTLFSFFGLAATNVLVKLIQNRVDPAQILFLQYSFIPIPLQELDLGNAKAPAIE